MTIACEIYCDASFGEITVNMLATIIVGMGPAQTLGNPSEIADLTAYADRPAIVVHSLDTPGIWIRTHR